MPAIQSLVPGAALGDLQNIFELTLSSFPLFDQPPRPLPAFDNLRPSLILSLGPFIMVPQEKASNQLSHQVESAEVPFSPQTHQN